MNFILGTAGHIDHGKTTLVRALTGIDCDRLQEEKRRGITIELGFAYLDLEDGSRVSIVDVPGHERFIKNMVAGAFGVDNVLFVIAADEGIMPQTIEHLEICSLLGIHQGIIALTKTDLVDAEWLAMVQEDIKKSLAGTFLANAPLIPVSSLSREGLPRLKEEIKKQLYNLKRKRENDIFRLPVDRAFSLKGFGTVISGSIISGSCSQGEKLAVFPSAKVSRARSLQVHNTPVETAYTGQRCAVNLQGLELADIQRGDIIARPDTLFPSKSWLVHLTCLKSSPLPIKQRSEIHFHHATKECMAKIKLLNGKSLEPGQSTLAEVKFAEAQTAIFGDHFVIRSHSPLRTIGGGIVIYPLPLVLNKRHADYLKKIKILQKLCNIATAASIKFTDIEAKDLVLCSLSLAPLPGSDFKHLQVLTSLSRPSLHTALTNLEEKEVVYCWDRENEYWIDRKALEKCLTACKDRAEELHRREALKNFFSPNALISGWGAQLPQKFTQEILNLAVKKGILRQEGTGLKLASHSMNFDQTHTKILNTLLKKIKTGSFSPPSIKEITEEQGWEIKKIQPLLNYLCQTDQLIKVQENIYYSKEEFSKVLEKIQSWFQCHEELDVGDLKTLLGISRKYLIPILEYLDASHITYRVNNKRRLLKK